MPSVFCLLLYKHARRKFATGFLRIFFIFLIFGETAQFQFTVFIRFYISFARAGAPAAGKRPMPPGNSSLCRRGLYDTMRNHFQRHSRRGAPIIILPQLVETARNNTFIHSFHKVFHTGYVNLSTVRISTPGGVQFEKKNRYSCHRRGHRRGAGPVAADAAHHSVCCLSKCGRFHRQPSLQPKLKTAQQKSGGPKGPPLLNAFRLSGAVTCRR